MSTDARFASLSKAAEIVSVAEGQRVERSTLSRYVMRYASELNPKREGRETLINVDALLEHRRINIRVERASAAPYAKATVIASHKERQGAIRTRREEIELEREEEQRALERGELVPIGDVVKAAEAAIAAFSAALDKGESDAVDDIARRTRSEARYIRPGLRELKRSTLAAFRKSLEDVLPPEVGPSAT